jgi:hypothetical protein
MKFNKYDDFLNFLEYNGVHTSNYNLGEDDSGEDDSGEDNSKYVPYYSQNNNIFFKEKYFLSFVHILFDKNDDKKRLLELNKFIFEKQKGNIIISYLDLKNYYDNVLDIKKIRKEKLNKIGLE